MTGASWIDISYPMYTGMVIYPGNPDFRIERVHEIDEGGSTVSRVIFGTHTGTHIDAPSHFIPGGTTIDKIPLERMNGKAKVFDVTGFDEIDIKLLDGTDIQKDDILLFRTDNSLRWSCDRILDKYVTLTYDAADYLTQCGIRLVGIDYLTIERPRCDRVEGRSIHKTLLEKNILICEALNLKDVFEGEYTFYCIPLNILNADGCPVRCVIGCLNGYI